MLGLASLAVAWATSALAAAEATHNNNSDGRDGRDHDGVVEEGGPRQARLLDVQDGVQRHVDNLFQDRGALQLCVRLVAKPEFCATYNVRWRAGTGLRAGPGISHD